jgi:hypothetical protein
MTGDDMLFLRQEKQKKKTYLRLAGGVFIVAIGSSTQRRAGAVLACANTTALGQVLLTFRLADLDLCLLTATAQLLGLEGALRLELGAPMLGDVAVGHGRGGLS